MPQASTRPVFPELAAEIGRSGRTLTQLSHVVDCNPQHLAHIIRGHGRASAALRSRIADALGRPESELFATATGDAS